MNKAQTPHPVLIPEETRAMLRQRKTIPAGKVAWLIAYKTRGGTYVIANNGVQTDDGRPHDLAVVDILGNVTSVNPLANPAYIAELVEVFA